MTTCSKCGGEREVGRRCRPCASLYHNEWTAANREKMSGYHKKWISKHRLIRNESQYRWNKKNPEKVAACHANWKERNPEVALSKSRDWAKRNPDKRKVFQNARRARMASAHGVLSTSDWDAIVRRQGSKCFDCGVKAKLTIGHKVPLSKGGSNLALNIVGQCASCNARQHTRLHPAAKPSLFDGAAVR